MRKNLNQIAVTKYSTHIMKRPLQGIIPNLANNDGVILHLLLKFVFKIDGLFSKMMP
jgi:hypothetical protein